MTNPENSQTLTHRTAPTWEVELLISGVAVFAMLQLPVWLDDQMFALEPRVGGDWRLVLLMSYLYAKSAVVVLAATFAIHLLLRAQWIALVGMHSVYPQGIRLDRIRMGPIQRAIEEARSFNTTDAIERADNRASVLFAIGVSIAQIIATVCITVSGGLLLMILATRTLGIPVNPVNLMAGVFVATIVPFVLASVLDRQYAARMQPDGRAYRMLAATQRFYTRIGMGQQNNYIIAMLVSNGGERKMMGVVIGVMLLAIFGVGITYDAMKTSNAIGSYAQFPDAEEHNIQPEHYDDLRDPARDAALPFVQSQVIVDPYLKLTIPYRPERDEPAMRTRCTRADALKGHALAAAQLACLQVLRAVTLDGKPLANLRYEIASDPRTNRPALLAMIDARALPSGRHELRIARPARVNRKPDKDNPDPGFDVIAFWR